MWDLDLTHSDFNPENATRARVSPFAVKSGLENFSGRSSDVGIATPNTPTPQAPTGAVISCLQQANVNRHTSEAR